MMNIILFTDAITYYLCIFRDTDTSIRNKELHTPLICAAIRGNTSACEALVSKGASTDTDANGRNIIHIAAEKNNFKFLKVKSKQ